MKDSIARNYSRYIGACRHPQFELDDTVDGLEEIREYTYNKFVIPLTHDLHTSCNGLLQLEHLDMEA